MGRAESKRKYYDPFADGPKTIAELCRDTRTSVSERIVRGRLADGRMSLRDIFTKPKSFINVIGRRWQKDTKLYCAFGIRAPLSVLHRMFNSPVQLNCLYRRVQKLGDNTNSHWIETAILSLPYKNGNANTGRICRQLKRLFPPNHCSECNVELIIGNIRKGKCRICYLRQKNGSEPRRLSQSGYRGVRKMCNRWEARIRVNGESKVLGYFNTALEASNCYQTAFKSKQNS